MPPTVVVKSNDEFVKKHTEGAASSVIAAFGDKLPEARLLCFFDDQDWMPFKESFGLANRGFYGPIGPGAFSNPSWPEYVKRIVLVDDPPSWILRQGFDHIIYLHGSTSADELGLTMTFAHELQHFVQRANMLHTYAAGKLLLELLSHWPEETSAAVGLKSWPDIPHERDAKIVAKRVVEKIFGEERTREFIDRKIASPVNAGDREDWQFIQSIASGDSYDLQNETRSLFQRLTPYKDDCKRILNLRVRHIPELKNVDLDELFIVV